MAHLINSMAFLYHGMVLESNFVVQVHAIIAIIAVDSRENSSHRFNDSNEIESRIAMTTVALGVSLDGGAPGSSDGRWRGYFGVRRSGGWQ